MFNPFVEQEADATDAELVEQATHGDRVSLANLAVDACPGAEEILKSSSRRGSEHRGVRWPSDGSGADS